MACKHTASWQKSPQQRKEVCHLPARAQQHVHPHSTRPVLRCLPPAATLVSLTALPMSLQLAPPNPPSTFPIHVDWLMYASMSGSPVSTHTNDVPSHPIARMEHQSSPPALLDGTGLLQMPPQRTESPAAKQDYSTNWEHMRSTRSHQRRHDSRAKRDTETQCHTYTPAWKQRRPTDRAISTNTASPRSPGTSLLYAITHRVPKAHFFRTEGSIFTYRRLNCSVCVHTKEPKQPGRHHIKTFSLRFFLISKLIPKAQCYFLFFSRRLIFLYPKAHFF